MTNSAVTKIDLSPKEAKQGFCALNSKLSTNKKEESIELGEVIEPLRILGIEKVCKGDGGLLAPRRNEVDFERESNNAEEEEDKSQDQKYDMMYETEAADSSPLLPSQKNSNIQNYNEVSEPAGKVKNRKGTKMDKLKIKLSESATMSNQVAQSL